MFSDRREPHDENRAAAVSAALLEKGKRAEAHACKEVAAMVADARQFAGLAMLCCADPRCPKDESKRWCALQCMVEGCATRVCDDCGCGCGLLVCGAHGAGVCAAEGCDKKVCSLCVLECGACGSDFCIDHSKGVAACGHDVCTACATRLGGREDAVSGLVDVRRRCAACAENPRKRRRRPTQRIPPRSVLGERPA